MAQDLVSAFRSVKGVNTKTLQELAEVYQERQKAMIEVSQVLGIDVSFSDEELLDMIGEAYSDKVVKDLMDKLGKVLRVG